MAEGGKRKQIFSATRSLLLEQGLARIQTRDVTERAGVSTGLLNHYFCWPELRAAAWAAIFADAAADLWQEGEHPAQALERFFSASFAAGARPYWRLWIEAEGLAEQDTEMARALAEARATLRDRMAGLLAAGVAKGAWQLRAPRATALRMEALRDGLAGLLLVDDAELDSAGAETHLREAFALEKADGNDSALPAQ